MSPGPRSPLPSPCVPESPFPGACRALALGSEAAAFSERGRCSLRAAGAGAGAPPSQRSPQRHPPRRPCSSNYRSWRETGLIWSKTRSCGWNVPVGATCLSGTHSAVPPPGSKPRRGQQGGRGVLQSAPRARRWRGLRGPGGQVGPGDSPGVGGLDGLGGRRPSGLSRQPSSHAAPPPASAVTDTRPPGCVPGPSSSSGFLSVTRWPRLGESPRAPGGSPTD